MAENRNRHPGAGPDHGSARDVYNQSAIRREERNCAQASGSAAPSGNTPAEEPRPKRSPLSREPRGVEKGIADADKEARTGSTDEPVRNTPPAGAWNDTSGD